MYLDNILHLRTSVLTKNLDALKALRFAADDFDLALEDEVTQKAGAVIESNDDEVLQEIVRLGVQAKLRQGAFDLQTVPLNAQRAENSFSIVGEQFPQ